MMAAGSLSTTPEFQEIWADCNTPRSFKECGGVDREYVGAKCGIHGSNSYFFAVLRYLLRHMPKGKFLDLGYANGESVIYAAHEGWKSYGIDFCTTAYELANKNLKRAEGEGYTTNKGKLACGNFFPRGFHLDISLGEEDKFRSSLDVHLARQPKTNPYFDLGLKLEEVDLFYHYQVESKLNMLNLFSRFARPRARFLFVESLRDTFVLPANVFLEENLGQTSLFRKGY